MPKIVAYPIHITNLLNKIYPLLPSHLTLTLEYRPEISPPYRVIVRQRLAAEGLVRCFSDTDELAFYLHELLQNLEKRKTSRH